MSEDQDRDSKTEEATEKRLSDAMEKGNVPFSRDLITLGGMASCLLAFSLLAGWTFSNLAVLLRELLSAAGNLRLDDRESAARLLSTVIRDAAAASLPIMAIIAVGTVLASLMQNPPSMPAERIRPQLSRISPRAGWGRLFGKAGWVEFLKSILKLVAVGFLLYLAFGQLQSDVFQPLYLGPDTLLDTLSGAVNWILAAFTVLALLLAAVDLVWTRLNWRKSLRMTKQEIKEEHKQAEGDPAIRARIRSIARQRSSRRMLEKVPRATMVIANPTHYAIALRYDSGQGGAPVVVAKGVDFLALKIRTLAEEHRVPVIENKPLARALYDKVAVDAQIPPEFYRAVAEIIHFLHSRRRIPRAAQGR